MTATSYIDTSALAKWYLNEAQSEEFDAYMGRLESAAISRLTVVEFRCLLARRRRSRDFDSRMEKRIFSVFEKDVRAGFLEVFPLEDTHAVSALDILNRLKTLPLQTLDALHLAIALDHDCTQFATADLTLADSATALGLKTVRFA